MLQAYSGVLDDHLPYVTNDSNAGISTVFVKYTVSTAPTQAPQVGQWFLALSQVKGLYVGL
jgi:hypothetical protein